MVPLPAQGHLNALLHLARIISTRGVPVHYVGAATHNRQAKERSHGWGPSSIHFFDVKLPSFATPPPDPNAVNKYPSHLLPTFYATFNLREPLGELLRSLSASYKRVVVIHDSLMALAAEEASFVSNAEAYSLVACSAFAVLHFIWEFLGEPADEEEQMLPKDVPRISFKGRMVEGMSEFLEQNKQLSKYEVGTLYNTCAAIEGRFINLVAQLQKGKPLWAIGPFNPIRTFASETAPRHRCIEWLDKQPPKSVMYVSFGTMTSVSDDQIAELAFGLEHSKQRFIWVLRDADRGDIYDGEIRKAQLPDGFEERVKGVGMVVRDWAPQIQILAHSSTGGFMSHCGWNSTMESLSMGIPIAAWPMHSDQPSNALLITDLLKVGVIVRDWSRREELISSSDIERAIAKLMISEEGNMIRKRAEELGSNVRGAISDGGTSITQLESFLAHISR